MPAILQPPIIFPSDIYYRDFGLNWADLGIITGSGIDAGVYLGHGISLVGTGFGHIWRSADFGVTWFDLGAITPGTIDAFANLGNGIVIFGDTNHRVWRSIDYGFTWTAVTPLVPAISITCMAYLGNGIAILGDFNGHVFRSVDYGATWADLGVVAASTIRCMAYLGNGIAILGDFNGHVFRSVDYGATWADLGVISTGTFRLKAMALLIDGVAVIGDTNNHVFRSVDYGATWADLGVITTNDVTCVVYMDNGIAILGDDNGHIFRSASAFERWKQFENSDRSCRVWNSVGQAIPHNVWTALNFNTINWQTELIFNIGTPTRLTCRTPGKYHICGGAGFDTNAVGYRAMFVRLNGVTAIDLHDMDTDSLGTNAYVKASTHWNMTIGDYVELMVRQTSGGALNIIPFAYYTPWFSMARVP